MSKHIKQISRTVKTLQISDKFVLVGGLLLIIGLFLPWFSINLSDLYLDDTQSTNAFTGLTYIIGYLCYIFTLTSLNTVNKKIAILTSILTLLLFLISISFGLSNRETIFFEKLFSIFIFLIVSVATLFIVNNVKFVQRIKKNVINLFVGVENLILIFVASMIYHKQALEYTSANTNFGLYLSLIGAGIIFYGGFLQMKLNKKNITKEAFATQSESLHSGVNLKPDLNIDKSEENNNNEQAKKENSQLSFGDYE